MCVSLPCAALTSVNFPLNVSLQMLIVCMLGIFSLFLFRFAPFVVAPAPGLLCARQIYAVPSLVRPILCAVGCLPPLRVRSEC